MEYYAIYTSTPGRPKSGGRVMVVSNGIHSLLEVFEDELGVYYAQSNRIIRPQAIQEASVYPVELSLCTKEITEGELCVVKDVYQPPLPAAKLDADWVNFDTEQRYSRKDVFRKVALVSENVKFLNNGDIVPSPYVSFIVISDNQKVNTKSIISPKDVTLKKNETLVALITCPKCGLKM